MTDLAWQQRLIESGQGALAEQWVRLEAADRDRLARQLADIDLDQVQRLFLAEEEQIDWGDLARRAEPPPAIRIAELHRQAESARRQGEAALRAGQTAVILVAGGQGSRLGFHHPKGMFPLGPVSGHSIFQILLERVLATSRRYGAAVPLYIMTSPATHQETVDYLVQNAWFGLPESEVTIFCQGTMPAVDARSGQLLLSAPGDLALAPDGHGGMLSAFVSSGCLEQARDRGIKYFSYGQIDNPLVQICQPELIGFHLMADSEMTSQVVEKIDPMEKVGNVVMVDGQMRVIEYSDLPIDAAQLRNADGRLAIWAGSIAVHVFSLDFLQRVSGQADALPFHRASKKVPFVDSHGVIRKPSAPNGVKFERFIFDLLPLAQRAIVVEGVKEEVFSAVKNAAGAATETAETSRRAMVALHTGWLNAAGIDVTAGTDVEISPLWALDEQQVVECCRSESKMVPARIESPTFLR